MFEWVAIGRVEATMVDLAKMKDGIDGVSKVSGVICKALGRAQQGTWEY